MKKLAIISTHPIQYQIPLFKNLQKKKIDTHVFFASNFGLKLSYVDPEFLVKYKWEIKSNILEGYKSYFPNYQKYKIDDFFLSFPQIEKHLKKKFDAILILGWNNLHYLKAIYFAYKYEIPIILRVESNLKSKTNIFKKIAKEILLRFFFKKVKYFLSIGKLNEEFLKHYGVQKKKIYKAPYFVDNNFFEIKRKKSLLKKKYKFFNKHIILNVGKFIKRKNPFDFLKLAEINKKNKNLLFLMIGDGNLKKDCSEYLKKNKIKNLKIIGFVNQNQLRDFYKMSSVLIQTSSYETWGLTINEALASGIPVICTKDCGAYYDLIKNKKTGKSYETGNINQLNNKLNLLLKENSKIKKADINKVISKHSIENTSRSVIKIIYEKKNF